MFIGGLARGEDSNGAEGDRMEGLAGGKGIGG